jgi:hypothetical protein
MKDFKLKFILSLLAGIVFSFVFILLAFATPLHNKEEYTHTKPKGKLEQVSQSVRNR